MADLGGARDARPSQFFPLIFVQFSAKVMHPLSEMLDPPLECSSFTSQEWKKKVLFHHTKIYVWHKRDILSRGMDVVYECWKSKMNLSVVVCKEERHVIHDSYTARERNTSSSHIHHWYHTHHTYTTNTIIIIQTPTIPYPSPHTPTINSSGSSGRVEVQETWNLCGPPLAAIFLPPTYAGR